MIDMNGVWRAAYAAVDGGRDDGDADEMATLELKDGLLTGNDPFGGSYSGNIPSSVITLVSSSPLRTDTKRLRRYLKT
ncbi:MAG: hypothetical protein WBD27_18260 [Pyrinomonadaceae bacterium]